MSAHARLNILRLATAERVLRLVALMQQRRYWTVAELMGEVRVSRRTVLVDLQRMRAAGVQFDPAPPGRFRMWTPERSKASM